MPRTPRPGWPLSRRRFLQAGVGTAAALALSSRLAATALSVTRNNADRAVAAATALQRSFWVGDGSFLYRESVPSSGNTYSYLWPFSHVGGGALDLFELGAVTVGAVGAVLQDGLPRYWDATGVPAGYE